MSRRSLAIISLAAAALFTACGNPLTPAAKSSSATSTLSDAQFQAAAGAAADAVMLRLADLPPGWSVDNSDDSNSDFQFIGECAPLNSDALVPGGALSKTSDDFTGESASRASLEVDVYRSAADAKAQIDGRMWLMSHCGQQLVKMMRDVIYGDPNNSFGYAGVSFREIATPALGEEARAYSMPVSISVNGVSGAYVVDLDWIFVRRSAIVAALFASPGFDGGSLPMDLARTIDDRMAAANNFLPQ